MNHRFCRAIYIIGLSLAWAALPVPGAWSTARAQISLPPVTDELRRLPEDMGVDPRVREQTERGMRNASRLARNWIDTSEMTVQQAAAQAADLTDGLLRTLELAEDPAGADIEDRIVVVLVATADAAALIRPGFEIVAEKKMSALDLSLLTLRIPVNSNLPQAVKVLRDANPGVAIDYNHLYDFTASTPAAHTAAAPLPATAAGTLHGSLRIGIIDSAVMRTHPAIAGLRIIARDFATAPGLRPETHGTAVASLIAVTARQQADIYAASVFFQLPKRAPGATAESLVAAMDWLAAERVDVINMSLAGPGNQLLETAIARLMQMQVVVVAAVGNNGPSGEPLYPAAYDGVIGVTAVDRKNRVFRYANRGAQVKFAARGVDVKVADSVSGGWRVESGTSMASPHVAVVIAQVLRTATAQKDALLSWLIAHAEDLGRKGLDPVYGHGLIAQPPIVLSVIQNTTDNPSP